MIDRSPHFGLRSDRWKLLANGDGSGVELYDLAADPGETRNVAAAEPAVVQRLLPRLLAWRTSLGCAPGSRYCMLRNTP